MADLVNMTASQSHSCCAFVHSRNFSQLLSCDSICSAILLNSSGHQVVTGELMLSEQKAVSQPVNWSSDASDVSNGHTSFTAKPALEVIHREQNIDSVSVWNDDCRLCKVQFMTPMKVFVLKLNAALASCVAKTLAISSKFARGFTSFAQHCAWKRLVLPTHSTYFKLNSASALYRCSDTPSSQDTLSLVTSNEETIQTAVLVQQTVIIVMTASHRLEIDYLWYDCTV